MTLKLTKLAAVVPAFVFASGCAGSEPASPPPDALTADPGHYTLVLENDSVRVLRINYGPGEKSRMHHHPDVVVVPLADGKTRFTLPDGTTQDADLAADTALYMPAGDHNPENVGATRSDALLVEFKAAAPGTATLPAVREGMTMSVLAEGPRATAYRITMDPSFVEPAGTTHDYDQVVIALGPTDVELVIDGKPVPGPLGRGDVQFIGRGVPHASKSLSKTSTDIIVVAVK